MLEVKENIDKIRDFAEVFTPKNIVNKMCDTIPLEIWKDINKTFFEPTCGDGNFLVEILKRKLKYCLSTEDKINSLKSIYGIDIDNDNVLKARRRLKRIILKDNDIKSNSILIKQINEILTLNIIQGDTLKDCEKIKFRNWKTNEDVSFQLIIENNINHNYFRGKK